jgi:5-methylcytosine-specific restriction endonuclease McrA
MRLLVASLEKRKFAVTERKSPASIKRVRDQEDDTPPRQRGDQENENPPRQRGERELTIRTRSRYVPAAERREVYRRDHSQCTYIDARGERCCETRYLELHHLQPFAKSGPSVAANLTLRCPAHNALAAESDFGLQLVTERRDSKRHESRARQPLVDDEVS